MKSCKICGERFENHSLYANHIRWKHRQITEAEREQSRKNFAKGIETRKNKKIQELGPFVEIHKTCERCNKNFTYKKREKNLPDGFDMGIDKNGFFIHTHRARSKSFSEPSKIDVKSIKFIDSTG